MDDRDMPKITQVPDYIGRHTKVTMLSLCIYGLKDVPTSIESPTARRELTIFAGGGVPQ